ncbi:F-box domain-containing protein [Drechmeria coniospora]|uniref:F-box domain-containing protein n=1 Tax=Drechmeria coniospora TaxID=98403 RepID=A0A151GTF2_DRECN|nr:F-box domain-containing protein [Drechmeria coniospora]KYK60385.1 F-box domain-containing protein [Drechmeria coniospora]ODA80326.1 hypothetical protein RJ55_03284 [Drechmeria coniospora]
MVQVLADPALSQHGPAAEEKQEAGMSREEHTLRMRELSLKRSMMRTPRRGWSMTDHQYHADTATAPHHPLGTGPQVDRQATIPEGAVLLVPPVVAALPVEKDAQMRLRPKVPPPRRSHSVTDKEPEPVTAGQPRPSHRMTLLDLPPELHYSLFDFLDPIDGVCLGLAHSRLYAIHRRKYGRVPLHSRYSGPNDMEWAWRGAGPLIRPSEQSGSDINGLSQLRVKGQVYCRKCGIARCELHRHLKDWMGAGYEYCEIKKIYGMLAGDGVKSYCFMSSPRNPSRCGRHGAMKVC